MDRDRKIFSNGVDAKLRILWSKEYYFTLQTAYLFLDLIIFYTIIVMHFIQPFLEALPLVKCRCFIKRIRYRLLDEVLSFNLHNKFIFGKKERRNVPTFSDVTNK